MALKTQREQVNVILVSLKLTIVSTMLKVVSDQGTNLTRRCLISKMWCYLKDQLIYYLAGYTM